MTDPTAMTDPQTVAEGMTRADSLPHTKASTDDFTRGYLLAVANLMHLYGQEVMAAELLAQLGSSKEALKDSGLDAHDLRPLRKLYTFLAEQRG